MFIDRFTQYLQFEKRFSPHTVTAYSRDLNQFQEFLTSRALELNLVSHHDIRIWVVELMDTGLEARTVSRKVSVLRSFYKFLQREQLITQNPMTYLKAPKIVRRLPEVIDEQKLDKIFDEEGVFTNDFNGLRNRVILELLYGTGMRLAELVGLADNDVNFYEQQVKVLGKRNKERIVPISAPLTGLLRKYIDAKLTQGFDNKANTLIVTNEGKDVYPKFIYRVVKSTLTHISAQNKRSPHILRHSFATALLNRGADLNAIKELLGHASLAATQVYTHNTVEKLKLIYKQAHPRA